MSDWRSSDRLGRGGKRGTVRSGAVSRQGSLSDEPFTAEAEGIRGCPVIGGRIKFASRRARNVADGGDRNAPWCNWQHACLWSRRVLVRSQEGQLQHPQWLRPVRVFCIEWRTGKIPRNARAKVSIAPGLVPCAFDSAAAGAFKGFGGRRLRFALAIHADPVQPP